MVQLTILLAQFIVFASPTSAPPFGWREILSVLGFLSPIVFGLLYYLLKKKQEAEGALHVANLNSLRDHVAKQLHKIESTYKAQLATSDSQRAQQKENLDKLEKALLLLTEKGNKTSQDVLSHQNVCSSRYVARDVYSHDIAAQKEHIRTIKELINQQIETVEKLVRL